MSTPTLTKPNPHLKALHRLWIIAQGHSGQCRYVARFLLGLYNGTRFPFNLTDFRGLDVETFRDCLQVLALDHHPKAEVHVLLGVPGKDFEQLARDWSVRDHSRRAA